MSTPKISTGLVHDVPEDLYQALMRNSAALVAWEVISPIARNEWICWTVTVKQQKTRDEHVKRAVKELAEGKKRPCCWMGCIHRTDKPVSPSVKGILEKRKV